MTTLVTRSTRSTRFVAATLLTSVLGLAFAVQASAQACAGGPVIAVLNAPAAPVPPNTLTLARGAIAISATVNTPCEDATLVVRAKLRLQGVVKATVNLAPSVTPGPGVTSLTASGVLTTPGFPVVSDGVYTLEVVASEGGNVYTESIRTVKLLLDNTPPQITFRSPADGVQIAAGSTIRWDYLVTNGPGGDAVVLCAYDADPFVPCAAIAVAGSLTPGLHGFRVQATDQAGNVATAVRAFDVLPRPGAEAPIVDPSVSQQRPEPRCRVPDLRGLTLAAATSKLKRAGCRLGMVTRPSRRALARSPNAGKLRVQRQSVKAGSVRAGGHKVGLTLVHKRKSRPAR